MSEADREQKTALLSDLWTSLLVETSRARELSVEQLETLSAQQAFFTAEKAQSAHLIDRVGYLDELIDDLATRYQASAKKHSFRQIDFEDYANAMALESKLTIKSGERIAVVYAEGEIIDGGKQYGSVAGDWLAQELRRLRNDSEVKAVVLRVNSPGGSAVASEIIQRETRRLAAEKPLIVSMGSYAASGGYWISAYADSIVAQPYTITGSIGVFGLVFNIQEAAAKLAIQFDGVKTAPFADIHSLSRPRTEEEMALIQQFTDEIYTAFVDRVADGRALETSKVRELAEGRVWSGLRAQQLALVDHIGGLKQAIANAQDLAQLDTESIEQIPSPSSFAESLARYLEATGEAPIAREAAGLQTIRTQFETVAGQLKSLNDPRHVYTRMPYGFEGL